jgi:hypothetical protein
MMAHNISKHVKKNHEKINSTNCINTCNFAL